MTLKQLAVQAKMTPAKAHPYLVSFGKIGLVAQDPVSGRYGLGALALRMEPRAVRGENRVEQADQVRTKRTAGLRTGLGLGVPRRVRTDGKPRCVLPPFDLAQGAPSVVEGRPAEPGFRSLRGFR